MSGRKSESVTSGFALHQTGELRLDIVRQARGRVPLDQPLDLSRGALAQGQPALLEPAVPVGAVDHRTQEGDFLKCFARSTPSKMGMAVRSSRCPMLIPDSAANGMETNSAGACSDRG